MEKKIVFIIGASSGIGYEIAKKMIAKDYFVYNGSRTKCDILGVVNFTLDATNTESIKKTINEIVSRSSRIDIFIYCAGFSLAAPFEITEETDYRYLFEVNFFGFVCALKDIVPLMRKQNSGQIVGISSIGSIFPIPFDCFYSASKAAMNMFIYELAIELKDYNIKVVTVMPGGTATEFTKKRKVYKFDIPNDYDLKQVKAVRKLAKIEQQGMKAENVAKAILKIIEGKPSSTVIAIGVKNKAYVVCSKLLPQAVTLHFNNVMFDQ